MDIGHDFRLLVQSIYEAAAMFWEVLWALVLGFTLSGIFQVFVSKRQMQQAFGKPGLREVALATAFGAASSSCSYAAVATAKTAFKKGAALVPALAFMFASTNMVFELGLVLWLLMGWRFVLAEFIGAFVLIGIMWLIVHLTLPKGLEQEARDHPEEGMSGHDHGGTEESETWREKIRNPETLVNVARSFVMDWGMLWKEITAGFLIAGFLSVLVPNHTWQSLFMAGSTGPLHLLENAIVGPLIAIASFVCSVGNIPLASILWAGGISFGGVISFIYADLIIVPLILAYKKYYGWRTAAYITLVLFASMVAAGLLVDVLFSVLHLIPTGPRPASAISRAHFAWDYTTWLDLAFGLLALFLIWLTKRHKESGIAHGQESCH
jgi:uncharacterized membrane protein YraQ (UPF0718 family)